MDIGQRKEWPRVTPGIAVGVGCAVSILAVSESFGDGDHGPAEERSLHVEAPAIVLISSMHLPGATDGGTTITGLDGGGFLRWP